MAQSAIQPNPTPSNENTPEITTIDEALDLLRQSTIGIGLVFKEVAQAICKNEEYEKIHSLHQKLTDKECALIDLQRMVVALSHAETEDTAVKFDKFDQKQTNLLLKTASYQSRLDDYKKTIYDYARDEKADKEKAAFNLVAFLTCMTVLPNAGYDMTSKIMIVMGIVGVLNPAATSPLVAAPTLSSYPMVPVCAAGIVALGGGLYACRSPLKKIWHDTNEAVTNRSIQVHIAYKKAEAYKDEKINKLIDYGKDRCQRGKNKCSQLRQRFPWK